MADTAPESAAVDIMVDLNRLPTKDEWSEMETFWCIVHE